MIEGILNTRTGRLVISALFGLGIASLFRRSCKGSRCVVVRAPEPDQVQGHIFKYDDTCYKFVPMAVSCPEGSSFH
jgi:hypothetical protein